MNSGNIYHIIRNHSTGQVLYCVYLLVGSWMVWARGGVYLSYIR